MKKSRRILVLIVAAASSTGVAFASGGTIRPATSGHLDYLTSVRFNQEIGPNDRLMTRFGLEGAPSPLGSEFDPNSILCGARARMGHLSNVTFDRPLFVDVRLEDPSRPGYPDVGPDVVPGAATVPAGADTNAAPPQCSTGVTYRGFTFGGGLGVPDPGTAFFLTIPTRTTNRVDPCYMALETSVPANGRSKYFDSVAGAYRPAAGNLWLDAIVMTPRRLDLQARLHGSARFPGDRGRPVWFLRADQAGSCVDDFISTTLVIDNASQGPIGGEILSLIADRSVLNPSLAPKDYAASFRLAGNPGVSLASGNPYTWPPGRTVLRASLPVPLPARFRSRLPLNVSFFAETRHEPLPGPRDLERAVLGLRRQRGQVDDGTAEALFLPSSPAVTGDLVAQRFRLQHTLPGCASPARPLRVIALQVGASRSGGRGGFDAVELRRDDPVLANSADPSPNGRLGGIGIVGDGQVGVPVPAGGPRLVSVPLDPPATAPLSDDLWAIVYASPRDTSSAGSFVAEDRTIETLLGESFFSRRGAVPFVPEPGGNWMLRILFDAGSGLRGAPLEEEPLEARPRLPVRVGDEVPIRTLRDLAGESR